VVLIHVIHTYCKRAVKDYITDLGGFGRIIKFHG